MTTTSPEIVKGSTVRYQDGYYVVSARYAKTVNLASIFTQVVRHKKVPVAEVTGGVHDEWYDSWTKSESYMSM